MHRVSNAVKTKYGISNVLPVTIAVMSLDLARRMSVIESERLLRRSARQVAMLTALGEEQSESKEEQEWHGAIEIPTHLAASMARLWYAQEIRQQRSAMTLRKIVLTFFNLVADDLRLERVRLWRTQRRVRDQAYADFQENDTQWSGESLITEADTAEW